jgi:pantoate--beta-alanine ligase
MIVLRTLGETRNTLSGIRDKRLKTGLVPTMGALHEGHVSLLNCCRSENDVTIASIFVNPAQFNDAEDFRNYPRTVEKDLHVLESSGCDIAFVPDEKTIYPEPDERVFDFGNLGMIMEGRYRPGHFNGVAKVVSRLFQIIEPDRAYFGEKDIQQLAVIRRLTTMLGLPVKIRACPTLREKDGLAMSSRNVLLGKSERENAPLINRTLKQALSKAGNMNVADLTRWVKDSINANPWLDVEYFEIVDADNFQPVEDLNRSGQTVIACIAVRAGKVRLIDNIFFSNFAAL